MKFQAWEEQFLARILQARQEEAKYLLYYHICRGVTLPVTWCLPIIACMLNLIAYSLLHDGALPPPPDTFALVAFYKLAGMDHVCMDILIVWSRYQRGGSRQAGCEGEKSAPPAPFALCESSLLPRSLSRSLTHSLTHSLARSLTHSLTHPPTHAAPCRRAGPDEAPAPGIRPCP
jgi:hypothetical protein